MGNKCKVNKLGKRGAREHCRGAPMFDAVSKVQEGGKYHHSSFLLKRTPSNNGGLLLAVWDALVWDSVHIVCTVFITLPEGHSLILRWFHLFPEDNEHAHRAVVQHKEDAPFKSAELTPHVKRSKRSILEDLLWKPLLTLHPRLGGVPSSRQSWPSWTIQNYIEPPQGIILFGPSELSRREIRGGRRRRRRR